MCMCFSTHQAYIQVIQVLQKVKLMPDGMADGSMSRLHGCSSFPLNVNSNSFYFCIATAANLNPNIIPAQIYD